MPHAHPRPERPADYPPGHPPDGEAQSLLTSARRLAAEGKNQEAFAAYLGLLRRLPSHLSALHGLGRLAYRCGYRSAARTAYEQLVSHWPLDTAGRNNLGSLLHEDGDLAGARLQFQAALAIDATLTDPHRGLARVAQELGEHDTADLHWRRSFPAQAVVAQPCQGDAQAIRLLVLVSTSTGNIPTQHIMDERIHAVTVLFAEYYRPDLPLPPHDLIFNGIGDADRCGPALTAAEAVVARSRKPVINHPARVCETGRAANAERLGGLPGVRAPWMRTVRRDDLQTLAGLPFPLLLRAPGFHTGQHFLKVETGEDLEQAAAELPGEELLAIEYLDAHGDDGLARKYRVMCIGGSFYPLHLAISANWKVHYFSAGMLECDAHRAEERQFLEHMPEVIGPRAMAALAHIAQTLGLDYAGVDFALGKDGSLLLFEANATMLIQPPAPEPVWDYRRVPTARALEAAQRLIAERAEIDPIRLASGGGGAGRARRRRLRRTATASGAPAPGRC